jgi:hypothetical protein
MEPKGQTWPLYLVVLLTLIGAAIGLLHPQTFGEQSPDLKVGWILGVVALVMAIVIAFPIGRWAYNVPSILGNRENPDANSLLGRLRALQEATGGNAADLPGPNSALGRLRALQRVIGENAADPDPNSVLGRLRALQRPIGEDPMQPGEGTLLHRLEQLRLAIDHLTAAVGTAAQIQAGTVLSRLGPPGGAAE